MNIEQARMIVWKRGGGGGSSCGQCPFSGSEECFTVDDCEGMELEAHRMVIDELRKGSAIWKRAAKMYRARTRFYKYGNDTRGETLDELCAENDAVINEMLEMANPMELEGRCIEGMSRIHLVRIVRYAHERAVAVIDKYSKKAKGQQ